LRRKPVADRNDRCRATIDLKIESLSDASGEASGVGPAGLLMGDGENRPTSLDSAQPWRRRSGDDAVDHDDVTLEQSRNALADLRNLKRKRAPGDGDVIQPGAVLGCGCREPLLIQKPARAPLGISLSQQGQP
jgi:hypothetical protein